MVDRINVSVAHLAPSIEVDKPDAVHSVGVSGLGEYLRIMYGEDVPHDEKARRLSTALLDAMSELSVDEELPILTQNDPLAWLPRWLQLAEPVATHAKSAGRHVNRQLIECEASEDKALTNDLTYMVGLFDLTSFVVAAELALDHPRYQQKNLLERSRRVIPAHHQLVDRTDSEQKRTIDFLSTSPLVGDAYRRRVTGLRQSGEEIITNTENYVDRMRALAQHLPDGTQ